MANTDLIIRSLRGGVNEDPPISLPDDQCTVANNVEFVYSMLGERRQGTSALTLPAFLSGKDRITLLARHLPSSDETASELWALGVTGTATASLGRKTTSWQAEVTISDTPALSGFSQYRWCALSFHNKLFLAYDSNVDRLHVWDGTTLRRAGLAEPAAPTGANTGAGGTFTGTRYYRVRYIEKSGSTVLRRSEPSDVLTFAPSGSKTGITVTKPTTISEGETHWELEASVDDINFFVIATTAVGTTTYDDTQDYALGYAQTFDLSPDIGDYTLLGSVKYLCADGDRLLGAGSWETASLKSRVVWTPVSGETGAGNDERLEDDTDPFKDLDAGEGGEITGLISGGLGSVYVFKNNHIYKLVRSGLRSRAYDDVTISKERGALHGSICQGVDETGRACIYFLDPAVGPCRILGGEVQQCGDNINATWLTVNPDAAKVVCSSIYYPTKRQVIWNIATSTSDTPTLSLVLHVSECRVQEDGVKRGYALWDGTRAKALCMVLYSDNVEAGTARNRLLKPLMGLEGLGLLHLTDTTSADNAVPYTATITTKPYVLGNLLGQFGVMSGLILAKAVTGAKVNITISRDFDVEIISPSDPVVFDALNAETHVIRYLDDMAMSELRAVQITITDTTPAGNRFELHMMALRGRNEQDA